MDISKRIRSELLNLKEDNYKKFNAKLMPTVNPDDIIGIRIPILRKYAKELKNDENINEFFRCLPHKYHEENNVHAFLIEQILDFDKCIEKVEKFLPYIDNWATCDMLNPKCFKKHKQKLLPQIQKWIESNHTYTVRFGIKLVMNHFLDDGFDVKYLKIIADIKSDEYYINMMIAWFFATALAKQYAQAIRYVENKKLPVWVHNKTIQKAVESYRITDKQKDYLRTLRIKNK